MHYGLVKNTTNVAQRWGSHEIAAGAIGRMPITVVESLRSHPMRELIVIDDVPNLKPFILTEVEPFGPRYRR